MSIINAQFQDWKGNIYHFETSADMIKGASEAFAPLEHNHDERYYTKTKIDEMAENLKEYVVNGKEKIANAINDKTNDNQMNKDNTFDELADSIRNIKTSNGDYDPYLYLCSLLEESEHDFEEHNYYLHHQTYRDNRVPGIPVTKSGLYIHYQGMEVGDGRVYSQWACRNNIHYMGTGCLDGEGYPQASSKSGFIPPPNVEHITNAFYMKPGQFLFCAVGTNQNNKPIDFIKDGFIKLDYVSDSERNGKLVPLINPKQERIYVMERSEQLNTWGVIHVTGTIMAYQCQEAPLDLCLYFKDYYAGTFILIPTYIYRKTVKQYDFPNMIRS